jgi:hypothetical protein
MGWFSALHLRRGITRYRDVGIRGEVNDYGYVVVMSIVVC